MIINELNKHFNAIIAKCSNCGSDVILIHQNSKFSKRYRCSECKKTFVNTTNTCLYKLKKVDKIDLYLNCLYTGLSLRKSAKIAEISLKTAFLWRHRFLKAQADSRQDIKNDEIVELAIEKSKVNLKGQKNLQESKDVRNQILNSIYWINKKTEIGYFENINCGNLDLNKLKIKVLDKIIFTQHQINIDSETNLNELQDHIRIKGYNKFRPKSSENYNVNLVNARIIEFNLWLGKFNGVASKYKSNYFKWHQITKQLETCNNPISKLAADCFTNTKVEYNISDFSVEFSAIKGKSR